MPQLVSLVNIAIPTPRAVGQNPGNYRVAHMLDLSCEVLPAVRTHAIPTTVISREISDRLLVCVFQGEEVDVDAANAAMSAAPATVTADSVEKVLLLGANGMLGPPVVSTQAAPSFQLDWLRA